VRVRYATYESNEEMLAKVLTGNSGWDVVFPTYNRIQPMRDYGLLAPLRHEWLANTANLAPDFRAPTWDPGLNWNVPYMWFSTGIVYNRSLRPAPARWADLWDPRLQGRLTMLDDPEDMLGACLKKLGLSFSASDPGQLHCSAHISMPRSATSSSPAMCWPPSSGPPPRSRPSTPPPAWHSPTPLKAFPSTAIAP
jgi:spermidine/putrescine transport system substrate-binding protein